MSGSEVIEDLNTHFGEHLKNIPNNKVPSSITTIRGINKLTVENTVFTPDSNISYNFNINKKMNHLNIKALLFTNQLKQGESYDLDYNNKIIENSNYDAKKTYKKNRG
ncbi:MAG: hypothetical protein KAG96_05655 [Ichthyobacteriaceae bacterium]|nr:hypothetical protein [Ichthyobacteriaceae bacterium]